MFLHMTKLVTQPECDFMSKVVPLNQHKTQEVALSVNEPERTNYGGFKVKNRTSGSRIQQRPKHSLSCVT